MIIRFSSVLLVALLACHSEPDTHISFVHSAIEQHVKGYINAKQQEHDSIAAITVFFEDTVVRIASAEPDLSATNLLGLECFGHYKVYYVGTSNAQLYRPSKQVSESPTIKRPVHERKNGLPSRPVDNTNFELWELIFRGNTLKSYSPKNRIDKYVK